MKAKTTVAKRRVLCLNCGHIYFSGVPRPKCGNCGGRRFASGAEEIIAEIDSLAEKIKAGIKRVNLLREKLEGGLDEL